MSNSNNEDKLAQASLGVLGTAGAAAIGTKTIVGAAVIKGIGLAPASAKLGLLAFGVTSSVGVAPIVIGAAAGYLAVKGIKKLFG